MAAQVPAAGTAAAAPHRWRGTRLWLALALLVALPFLFHWRLLTPDLADRGSFAAGDFSGQHYAPAVYLAQRLASGSLPLWCDGSYAGFPFLADIQNASLYPPRLLAILLSAPWGFPYLALELEAILHYSLAAVLMFLLGRRLFTHDGAALLAALAFTFGGYLTGYPAQQLAILETAAWLPLALLCADHAVTQGRILSRWTLALAVALALSLLAGHPQIAMYVYYLVAAYSLWRRLAWRSLAVLALAATLSVLLTAAQLLPAVEYARLSSHAGLAYDAVSRGLPLQETIQVLLPGTVSGYSPLYVGILPLLLGGVAIAFRPRRDVRFWPAVAVVSFLLCLGNQVFLHRLFYLVVPGWRLFRNQERLACVVAFAACVLVGYGAEAVLAGGLAAEERRRLLRGVGRFVWLLVALVTVSFLGLVDQGWTSDSRFYWVLAVSVYVLIVGALAWALLRWGLAPARPTSSFLTLAAALLLFDLFSVGWRHGFSSDLPQTREVVPPAAAAVLADAGSGGPLRVYNEWRLPGNYGVQFGLEDVWGASPLRLARYERLVSTVTRERLWSLLAVRYVLTWEETLSEPSEAIAALPVAGGDTTYVHRLERPGADAWLVHAAEQVPAEQALARLADGGFDATSTALTEEPLAEPVLPASGPEAVAVLERTPERIVLSVRASQPALLLLSEIAYPGWRVTVDGAGVRLLVADYVLRAVPVGAGEHVVEMQFRPSSWAVGVAVSSGTLMLLVIGFAAALVRERRDPRPPAGAAA